MLRIVIIPETGYKAVWNTVTDRFYQDANGDHGWDNPNDIDTSNLDYWDALEFKERISLIW